MYTWSCESATKSIDGPFVACDSDTDGLFGVDYNDDGTLTFPSSYRDLYPYNRLTATVERGGLTQEIEYLANNVILVFSETVTPSRCEVSLEVSLLPSG